MSRRTALALTKNKLIALVAAILIVGGGVGIWSHRQNPYHVQVSTNSQHQTTNIKYDGQSGVDALTLLKKHADVKTKHYSFGDLVASINGTPGNGPKYWIFYVNGKESLVGAGSYITKSSDKLEWRLQ